MRVAAETYHLFGHHDDGFDGESAVAMVKEILQTGAQEIDDQNVV